MEENQKALIIPRDSMNEALSEKSIFDVINFIANIRLDKHTSLVCTYWHIRII